ncbi:MULTISPECIES: sensor histidine kinase [unclassified Paenibacillus]|uniref:sensor histidine kinase n=1 Tax=unclassified Paenibacillus TaxID=185978 RepID=UPI002F3FE320
MQRKVWFMAIGIIIILILINNTVYYFMTKKTLEEALKHELLSLGKQIELTIEQTRLGSEKFEEQIGRELRASAIAAQYALDPDVDNVTNEQLKELSQKLDIKHISLLKRIQDDIVLYRSSDDTQIGKSTKTWVPWFSYFNQLFDNYNVKGEWLGQTLNHFWSGPFEVSSTDVQNIYKWGYYYDGSTNYIIDPYVHYETLNEFNEITGVERLLDDLVEAQQSLIEIMAVNPLTFPDGIQTEQDDGQYKDHIVQRPIIYGQYTVQLDEDIQAVQSAYYNNEIVTIEKKSKYGHVYKMFIPVSVKDKGISITDPNGTPMDQYVLSIVSDYNMINLALNKQFFNLGVVIILLTALSFLIAIAAMRQIKQSQDKAVRVAQETYVEEINGLFLAIRAQRHDFLNHVQTIHSLASLSKHKELLAYTKELTDEIRVMNDIINIGNPAIAALIRSKISQAETYRIQFACTFNDLNMSEMGAKTLDVNRILGNLIDNAFDEVMKYEESERQVHLIYSQKAGHIDIEVGNICLDAEAVAASPLFKSGYSTKHDHHQGIGLSIVKGIVDRYRGEVNAAAAAENYLIFTVKLPI